MLSQRFERVSIRRRLSALKWIVPVLLVVLVAAYELGPARWVFTRYGLVPHILADILVFGTIGPVLTYFALAFLERWQEEAETSDLQAQILSRVREEGEQSRQIGDETVQVLFGVSMLIASLKSGQTEIPQELAARLEQTNQTIDEVLKQLRSQVTKG